MCVYTQTPSYTFQSKKGYYAFQSKKIITLKHTTMKTVEQIKSELTSEEVKSFESLVRLGDSIQLAYETVLNERTKEDATEFYRNAYEN